MWRLHRNCVTRQKFRRPSVKGCWTALVSRIFPNLGFCICRILRWNFALSQVSRSSAFNHRGNRVMMLDQPSVHGNVCSTITIFWLPLIVHMRSDTVTVPLWRAQSSQSTAVHCPRETIAVGESTSGEWSLSSTSCIVKDGISVCGLLRSCSIVILLGLKACDFALTNLFSWIILVYWLQNLER